MDFKIVLLGFTGTGKTSIAIKFGQNTFSNDTLPTVGATFLTKYVILENEKIKIRIWDTAGQERYRALIPMYYRGAAAAILVYDITSRTSFDDIQNWISELKINSTGDVYLVLVGNKLDLQESSRTVSFSEGAACASKINAYFVETSAKTGEGIEELFVYVAKELKELHAKNFSRPYSSSSSSSAKILVEPLNDYTEKSSSCC